MGAEFVATFNDTTGMSNKMIQNELANAMNATNNGTFLGDSGLQISNSTNLTQVANEITIEGKSIISSII